MACFGRDELVGEVIELAENLEPIALIGAGGIGKTSVALTVLHHDRIKERFGDCRRFIRCNRFPASPSHFLARLSKVIGAGVENPEDLTPLRPFLSSKEMFIVLDGAESVLDPQGTNAREVCALVDELCQFKTLCILITSRITTVPRYCKRPEIPTLSMEASRDIFYGSYGNRRQSSIIDNLLERLDFHALSITLLATTASHNAWTYDRLAKEWDSQRARVLQIDYNESLAATIELSLDSPTFRSLGPHARDLLGVVAFFPQGFDENNLDWLFPTISNGRNIFDKFLVLSLTHRSDGFVTMLAPIRDYLGPQDPRSSPLLCATRDRYFTRLSAGVGPGTPGFEEGRWIMSEDVNVEHLLDASISTNPDRDDTWVACYHFMEHLYWHKPRQTILRSKIEALPDDHPSKPRCLSQLSLLLEEIGNFAEQKRLLTQVLELERRRGDGSQVADTLQLLSRVNRSLGLYQEGIQQATEALQIFRRFGSIEWQIRCSTGLALLLLEDKQLDAAEDVASHAIGLVAERGQELLACQVHQVLAKIYQSKGEKKKAIRHFGAAIGIASPSNWHHDLFWNYLSLARLFRDEGEFDDASAHTEQAKSHATNNAYKLGRAMQMQAGVWYGQHRFEEARSEASQALEILENVGAARDARYCRELLWGIERALKTRELLQRIKPVFFLFALLFLLPFLLVSRS
jgi:tetratricopeptide (TPR) repeat protein